MFNLSHLQIDIQFRIPLSAAQLTNLKLPAQSVYTCQLTVPSTVTRRETVTRSRHADMEHNTTESVARAVNADIKCSLATETSLFEFKATAYYYIYVQ